VTARISKYLLTDVIEDSEKALVYPTCRQPTDTIHFPAIYRAVPIFFAHCKPEKYSVQSLVPSGAYLGLAPGLSLSQAKTKSLLTQVHDKGLIEAAIFSLMVVDGQYGVFTIGGVSEKIQKLPSKDENGHIFDENGRSQNEIMRSNQLAVNKIEEGKFDWKWMKRHNTEGWWTILIGKLWVNGARILEKQTVILDVYLPLLSLS
jgi:hypothetical protein